jgi:hypothetical protein
MIILSRFTTEPQGFNKDKDLIIFLIFKIFFFNMRILGSEPRIFFLFTIILYRFTTELQWFNKDKGFEKVYFILFFKIFFFNLPILGSKPRILLLFSLFSISLPLCYRFSIIFLFFLNILFHISHSGK